MRLNDAYPSNYLKHSDLQGRAVRLTILDYNIEEIGQGADKDTKPVLLFKNTSKRLVLNKTNAVTIAEMYGDELDDWKGKLIELYPDRTGFGGKMVDCLRVRAPQGVTRPAPLPAPVLPEPEDDDSVPF